MVRKGIVLIVAVLFSIGIVNGQGINFLEANFESALKVAAQKEKMLFIDLYTEWCVPCKRLDATTFKASLVGDYFNSNYVSVKLNGEAEENSWLVSKYNISAYPSLLWFSSKGELLDVQVGFLDSTALLVKAKEIEKSNLEASFLALKERWESGERSGELYSLFVLNSRNFLSSEQQYNYTVEYLNGLTIEEKRTIESYQIIRRFTRDLKDDQLFRIMVENWDFYIGESEEPEELWIDLYRSIVRSSTALLFSNKREEYLKRKELLEKMEFQYRGFYLQLLELEELIIARQYSKALETSLQFTKRYSIEHPYLSGQLFYTFIINDLFLETNGGSIESDRALELAQNSFDHKKSQESLMYIAVAHAFKGDYKRAYTLLASIPYLPRPTLSNALFHKLNLEIIRP